MPFECNANSFNLERVALTLNDATLERVMPFQLPMAALNRHAGRLSFLLIRILAAPSRCLPY